VKAATAVLTRAHEQNDAEGTQRAAFMLLVKLMSAFRIDQRRRIFKRRMCGIYFLINREEIAYIGKSETVMQRVAQHDHDNRIQFDRWCYQPVPIYWLNAAEKEFIERYQPKHNVSNVTGARWRYRKPLRYKLKGVPIWNASTKAWPLEE